MTRLSARQPAYLSADSSCKENGSCLLLSARMISHRGESRPRSSEHARRPCCSAMLAQRETRAAMTDHSICFDGNACAETCPLHHASQSTQESSAMLPSDSECRAAPNSVTFKSSGWRRMPKCPAAARSSSTTMPRSELEKGHCSLASNAYETASTGGVRHFIARSIADGPSALGAWPYSSLEPDLGASVPRKTSDYRGEAGESYLCRRVCTWFSAVCIGRMCEAAQTSGLFFSFWEPCRSCWAPAGFKYAARWP
ncbi:hypothetical protein DM02DRAFT_711557 [Periconia macrospinosa]|uniref:Uncharacterized protein n=1 Tax=Periconia macrospinosa TaxID=97972 RepID=A0A2V1CZB2_9PLEO|nr:hypothetical protein DM02DRAFT_711557 [Periconia macrospinosa]